jgi:Zn-dependent protease
MNFLGGSFRIAKLFGIDVRIHVLFVLWIGYELFAAATRGGDPKREAIFYALLFGIVLLHEFGHCFGARSVGGDARDILLWPLGGLAYAYAPMRPWPQFVTVACGPLVNVILCILSAAAIFLGSGAAVLPGVNPLDFDLHLLRITPALHDVLRAPWFGGLLQFYHVNLWLLSFNLLPIYPLDGGQLFHAIIWPFLGLRRASIVAAQVGLVGCVVLGLFSLVRGGGGILLFIAIFGGMTCWQRYQAARQGSLVEDAAFAVRNPRGSFWSRLFKPRQRERRPAAPVEFPRPTPTPNPNPGAWQAQQDERAQDDAELDRILKKVSEEGVQSLSYVERQTLERITLERQRAAK